MNDDLKKGLIIAIVGAFIAFIATLSQTIIPIYFSSESSDFSIFIQPINIDAIPLTSNVLPSILKILDPSKYENTTNFTSTPAIIEVRNIHDKISPYKHTVFLKTISSDPNLYIELNNSEGVPPFKAEMYVYINQASNSLIQRPIIIQGIGSNGKTRNCTFYVTYISSEDLVRRGDNLSIEEAIKTYDKAIKLNPNYAEAWLKKGITLKSIQKNNEAKSAFRKTIELGRNDNNSSWAQLGIWRIQLNESYQQAKYYLDQAEYYNNLSNYNFIQAKDHLNRSSYYKKQCEYYKNQSKYYDNLFDYYDRQYNYSFVMAKKYVEEGEYYINQSEYYQMQHDYNAAKISKDRTLNAKENADKYLKKVFEALDSMSEAHNKTYEAENNLEIARNNGLMHAYKAKEALNNSEMNKNNSIIYINKVKLIIENDTKLGQKADNLYNYLNNENNVTRPPID
jgi:hypothetical protein